MEKGVNNFQKTFLKFLAGELNNRFKKEHLINTARAWGKRQVLCPAMFFYKYGYETAIGKKMAKVAMVKTIGLRKIGKKTVGCKTYKTFFHPPQKSEKKNNPGTCGNLYIQINNPHKNWVWEIVKMIKKGELENAYNELIKIDGIGHKVASLFIRDIISVNGGEKKIFKGEKIYKYLYGFPVDTWVEKIADGLKSDENRLPKLPKIEKLSGKNKRLAIRLIKLSLDAK